MGAHVEEHLRLTPVLLGVSGTLFDDLDMRSFDFLLVGNVGLAKKERCQSEQDFDQARRPQGLTIDPM